MINKILLATDLGLYTPYLLDHVNDLAIRHDASITIVHAIAPPGVLSDAVAQSYLSKEAIRNLKEEGMLQIISNIRSRIVDQLEDEFIDGQQGLSRVCDVRVLSGHPAEVILAQIVSTHADLVVMGSHSHQSLAPNLLGSVTAKILQMSRVPVYMVPMLRTMPKELQAS